MSVTPLEGKVAVMFAGALTFGLYCSTFLTCLRWLLCTDEGWKVRKNIRWPVVVATFFIFAFNTTYLSWNLRWNMVRVWHAAHDPPGSSKWSSPPYTAIVDCTLANFTVLLADFVLIVRCWMVYGRRNILIVVIPVSLWLAGLVCTVLQIYLQSAHIHNPTIGPYAWASVNMTFGPGIVLLPFWISTVLLNAYVSGAMIYRIYRIAKESTSLTSVDYLHSTILIIVESGVLYFPVTLAHLLVWFGPSSYAVDVVSILNAPLIGIAFNWLIIRVARNRAAESAKEATGDISTIKFNGTVVHRGSVFGPVSHSDVSSSETAVIFIR